MRISRIAGDVLRATRLARGMTLDDVARASGGRFKPSSIGGYERGERRITLDLFCELARFYGSAPDRLFDEVLRRSDPSSRRKLVIDLDRIVDLNGADARLLGEFVHQVKIERGDYLSDVITLRSSDIEELALRSTASPRSLLDRFSPALRPAQQVD